MKLNFWQWVGIILIIVGVVLFARRRTGTNDVVNTQPNTTNTVAPATTPATR